MKKKAKRRHKILSVALALLLYVAAWKIKDSPSIPSPVAVSKSILNVLSMAGFYSSLFSTLKIVLIGVGISFLFGALIATACAMSPFLNDLIMPIINSTKNVPSIALFPLFIVLMGIGDAPRIFVIIWNSLYPVISSTMAGLNFVDKEVLEAAENCGANKLAVYRYIKIPLATVNILEGLKIAIGNGFVAVVVAEMLGATKGLGYMILWSANAFQYPQMYAYIIIIALTGALINAIIEKTIKILERKIYYG